MPLKYFRCPAGKIETAECLKSCPLGYRCLTYVTLKDIAEPKKHKRGKFSTTQLLEPCRIAYLKLTFDYAIDPKERAFALLGTRHHQRLQAIGEKLDELKVEFPIDDSEITATLDLLELGLYGGYVLTDYKTWGSYSVMKARGLNKTKAGIVNVEPDYSNADWQLNKYRIEAERLGFVIEKMQIQFTARDGGTMTARTQGLEDKMGLIEIPRYDNRDVLAFFEKRNEELQFAVARNELPPMCPFDERWGGNRCEKFCDVFEGCPEGRKIHKLGECE